MQITYLDMQQAADILEASELLVELEGPGTSRTHILANDGGRDITLIVCSSTGEAMMIDECKYDQDAGGSVHDHARDTVRLMNGLRGHDSAAA